MEIQINYEYREGDLAGLPLTDLVHFVLSNEGKPENCAVSISFVTDEKIADLNERYRNMSGPTDVLAFECDGAGEQFGGADKGPYELGDVVIAVDVAERQTKEYETTFEEEISLLVVHGLLHLCGFDHMNDEDARVMEELEASILNAWSQRSDR